MISSWAEESLTLIADCEHRSERLSDWEANFIDSLRRQIEDGRRPTANQAEALDKIWQQATAHG